MILNGLMDENPRLDLAANRVRDAYRTLSRHHHVRFHHLNKPPLSTRPPIARTKTVVHLRGDHISAADCLNVQPKLSSQFHESPRARPHLTLSLTRCTATELDRRTSSCTAGRSECILFFKVTPHSRPCFNVDRQHGPKAYINHCA